VAPIGERCGGSKGPSTRRRETERAGTEMGNMQLEAPARNGEAGFTPSHSTSPPQFRERIVAKSVCQNTMNTKNLGNFEDVTTLLSSQNGLCC
jgi:hypothetical protein